jgi:ubiquinone/menaquinone biosynthesis C-methylase UbiE
LDKRRLQEDLLLLTKTLKKLLRIPADVSLRRELEQLLRLPANALIASASSVQKYYPYPARRGFYILQKPSGDGQERMKDSLPVPSRFGYGDTEEDWLAGGKKDIDNMMMLLTSTNFPIQKGSRILELGCATGRLIRWLADLAQECEIWGVDIDARQIVWCQENLTPPFNFATVTTAPHLPFEDKYFDLIYCGSVFTHIDDLADAWLLELKRVMRPGGRVYITVHDKHTADLIINQARWPAFARLLRSHGYSEKSNYYKFSMYPGDANCQVFYDIGYLCQHWGRMLKIISVTPEAYWHQTGILMEK